MTQLESRSLQYSNTNENYYMKTLGLAAGLKLDY